MDFLSVFSITVLFTVAVAEPLGCCMPRRYSGFIVNNGGYIADNDNSSLGVYVDVSLDSEIRVLYHASLVHKWFD